jgi:hypothetical protein
MGFGRNAVIWRKISIQLQELYGANKLEELQLSLASGSSQGWIGLARLGVAYSNDPFVNLLMLASLFHTTEE